jgi:hypothetical protein
MKKLTKITSIILAFSILFSAEVFAAKKHHNHKKADHMQKEESVEKSKKIK